MTKKQVSKITISVAEPAAEENKKLALEFFRKYKPAAGQAASCSCGWVGKIGDCEEVSLGENDNAWSWKCPSCGEVVFTYAFVL